MTDIDDPQETAAHDRELEERHAAYHGAMSRDERLDRWIEAVLGARQRFHVPFSVVAGSPEARYWHDVYARWAELYHAERNRP